MKVLFLDIDGVLNSGTGIIDHGLLGLIKVIVVATNCKIVLTSTWRIDYRHVVDAVFKDSDLEIFCQTPQTFSGKRSYEIKLWLDEHPEVTNFAIVDDVPICVKNFFQTDRNSGITEKIADEVIEHLRTNSKDLKVEGEE